MKPHLRVDDFHRNAGYKSKRRGSSSPVPIRANPQSHGQKLQQDVQQIQGDYATLAQSWEGREDIRAKGVIIELESAPGIDFDAPKLEAGGWVLLNEKSQGATAGQLVTQQRWFVPDGTLVLIEQILSDYLTKTRKVKGQDQRQPKGRSFVEAIERIGAAAVRELWTEPNEEFPEQQTLWFEVWLRAGSTREERAIIFQQFRTLAGRVGLRVGERSIELPEHTIVAAYGEGNLFSRDLALLNCIAEIRRVHDYADFFEALRPEERAEWANNLIGRTNLPAEDAPSVTVLDTGINRAHPLLDALIPEPRNLTINAAWSAADDDNHGTMMAGLCAYGNLTEPLATTSPVEVTSNLEGVKIVPPPAVRSDDEKLAGAYTAQGIALAEASAPNRTRVFCLATTMKGPNDPRPTSWSAEIDALAVGRDNDGTVRRLFCLSSGNVLQDDWGGYPDKNLNHQVENPGQAWNALCVGSYTDFDAIRRTGDYSCVASRGSMAPTNSTSLTWDALWPNKPDIVSEGGNAVREEGASSTLQLPELMLLSTHADFRAGVFGTMCGTSPATALASRMATGIQTAYPSLWPETVRALLVHSAQWTDAMTQSIPNAYKGKRDRARFLLRTVGYGVPNLGRAVECLNSRVTMVAECVLQPFKLEGEEVLFNEMHVHTMPWADAILTANPFERVRMRVTLSYFIEPNPGNRGYTSNYRYAGCGLRFRVSSTGQSVGDLEADVSKLAADDATTQGKVIIAGSNDGWMLGDQSNKGSIHSDIWEGSCADALSMKHVAVYPVTGWWRTRPSQHRAAAHIKYALVVTLEAENPTLDLYAEIAAQITTPITATVPVTI